MRWGPPSLSSRELSVCGSGPLYARSVLEPGDQVPEATVWLAPREQTTISGLVEDTAALFLFFLFAWSST